MEIFPYVIRETQFDIELDGKLLYLNIELDATEWLGRLK